MRSIRMLGLALIATMAVAGCGGDDDDNPFGPGNMGTFTGNITGHVTASLSGNAVFSVYTSGADQTFELVLSGGTFFDPTHLVTFARDGTRPGANTYNIGVNAGNFTGVIYIDASGDTYVAESGTVTITSSGTGGVNGNFTIVATDGTNDITVTGTFASECLEDATEGLTCG